MNCAWPGDYHRFSFIPHRSHHTLTLLRSRFCNSYCNSVRATLSAIDGITATKVVVSITVELAFHCWEKLHGVQKGQQWNCIICCNCCCCRRSASSVSSANDSWFISNLPCTIRTQQLQTFAMHPNSLWYPSTISILFVYFCLLFIVYYSNRLHRFVMHKTYKIIV